MVILPEFWRDDMGGILWLELLQPFTTVKDLYLCKELELRLVRALLALTGERAPDNACAREYFV